MAIYKEDIVDIELESGSIHRSFLNHTIGSGDADANRFGVRLFRNGEAVNLTNVNCQGHFRNSNGENIALTSHGTVEENVAFITLPQACYNYEGQFTLAIKLIGGGVTGTMRIVDGVVDNTNTGNAIAPTETVPTYEEILAVYADMEDAVEVVEGLEETLAEQYVGFRRYLNAEDDCFALDMGAYGIRLSEKPENLPTDFPASGAGYLIVLESESSLTKVAICCAAYNRRVWIRTGYEWIEMAKTEYVENQIDGAFDYLYDHLIPQFTHIAKGFYKKGTEIATAKTQYKFLTIEGVQDIGETYGNWYVTDAVAVQPFTFYMVTASAQYNGHCLYYILDADGNIIAHDNATSSTVKAYTEELIYTPKNAAKIQLATINGSASVAVYNALETGNGRKWVGKKWTCIGDSLTAENNRATKRYHDYVAEETGITVINLGAGGTGYKREYGGSGPFIDRVSSIPLDTDAVTLFGSGNDAIYTIGSPSDTGTDTLCGCINETIEAIFDRITTCQIGIVTPCPWQSYNPADDTNWMARYSAAIVEICKRWGIPCLDLYHCSNLRPWDADFRTAAYSRDDGNGVHPDENGHAIIAPRFEAFLDSLIMH